jgi:hypothetical protein
MSHVMVGVGAAVLSLFVILAVGILVQYWRDERYQNARMEAGHGPQLRP